MQILCVSPPNMPLVDVDCIECQHAHGYGMYMHIFVLLKCTWIMLIKMKYACVYICANGYRLYMHKAHIYGMYMTTAHSTIFTKMISSQKSFSIKYFLNKIKISFNNS